MRALVIGGAASGKSEYAEALAISLPGPHYYVATMMPCDEEDWQRIEKHRAMRAEKGFTTVERYTGLARLALPARGTVLLECLGNLAANELFSPGGAGCKASDAIVRGIEKLETQCNNLVVGANDIFAGGCEYAGDTGRYLELAAGINRTLAERFDRVAELVCGIPLLLKEVQRS
jgi:adenosylcobinamide kinase/adenosylcobinamide-phosphate guanylyltransferase